MIKAKLILLLAFLPTLIFGQVYQAHKLEINRLKIQLSEGILYVTPLTDKAVRVQWEKDGMKEDKEFVLVNEVPVPKFKVQESVSKLKLSTNSITINFDKKTGAIDYSDNTGKVFLSEKAGSRKLNANSLGGEPCFVAEQGFDSPADEHLFGFTQRQQKTDTGKFTDSHTISLFQQRLRNFMAPIRFD